MFYFIIFLFMALVPPAQASQLATYVGVGTVSAAQTVEVSGNVGIGTANPGTALDVQGTIRATGFSGLPGVQSKHFTATRDASTSSGTQSITGVGFRPKGFIVFAQLDASTKISWGISDCTSAGMMYYRNPEDNFSSQGTTNFINMNIDNTNEYYYHGGLGSCDADGITISWTKSGTTSGTIYMNILAWR